MSDRIALVRGDITRLEVDAIVNAANTKLAGGGGVDGAIHRAGGQVIAEECAAIIARQGRCPTGEAVVTRGGSLPARWVIHTVGPFWSGGGRREVELLAAAYRNSLERAVECGARTVAFPSISTGAYRFPKERAAAIAVREVRAFLERTEALDRVTFVAFDEATFRLYEGLLAEG